MHGPKFTIKKPGIMQIIGLSGAVVLFIVINILQKKGAEELRNNPNIGNLYSDSICEIIVLIDNEARSNHIVLENKMEYYFGLMSSHRWLSLKPPLSQWIHLGDTLMKYQNESVFYVHTVEGKVFGVHF
jgi:hypothetical protein